MRSPSPTRFQTNAVHASGNPRGEASSILLRAPPSSMFGATERMGRRQSNDADDDDGETGWTRVEGREPPLLSSRRTRWTSCARYTTSTYGRNGGNVGETIHGQGNVSMTNWELNLWWIRTINDCLLFGPTSPRHATSNTFADD